MNIDRLNAFIDRWRDIEQRQKDIDHARAVWVRDLLEACDGKRQAFIDWCKRELNLTDFQCTGLLERVAVLEVVPEAPDWRKHGGWRGLAPLASVMRKSERIAVVEAAKTQGLAISTVVRQRREAQRAARPDIAPVKRIPTPAEDAACMARFIAEEIRADRLTIIRLSPALREALGRWTSLKKKKPA